MPSHTLLKQQEDVTSIAQQEGKQESQEITKSLDFTDAEEEHLSGIQKRLETARDARDASHDEFDNMTYLQWCESNRKLANTYIKPRENREDSNYTSGIARQKMLAMLAAINNLDLTPEVAVFDQNNVQIAEIGQGLEDIIWKTEQLDDDEEKKLMRQYTLLEQGTVFVQEAWVERFEYEKQFTSEFDGSDAEWNKVLKQAFEGPSRTLLKNENVYLGDISQMDIKKQPYVFTVEYMPYETAKMIYGNWDRWEHVPKQRKSFSLEPNQEAKLYNRTFSLHSIKKNQVEVIKYEDKPNNEFQIIVNSVPMLPVGFPLPFASNEYSIQKQIYSPISNHFAYGKSLVSMLRPQAAVYDELMRLAVLKTQKSFKPPRVNLTGRVLNSRVTMPGVISHGFDPEQLKLTDPEGSQGMTSSEAAMIEKIQDNIDQNSVNPTFAGQQPAGTPTATQIIEVQRQARMVLGLTVDAASKLEKKVAELRLFNILENWFNPEDEVVDEARGILREKFRQFTRQDTIEKEGQGQRIIRATDEVSDPVDLLREEESIKRETGTPTRIIELNAKQIRSAKLNWYIEVTPREKRSSPANKLLFREMLADIQLFAPLGNINWQHLQERFAVNWEEDPQKLFTNNKQQGAAVPAAAGIGENAGQGVGERMLRPSGGDFGLPAAEANQMGVPTNVPSA